MNRVSEQGHFFEGLVQNDKAVSVALRLFLKSCLEVCLCAFGSLLDCNYVLCSEHIVLVGGAVTERMSAPKGSKSWICLETASNMTIFIVCEL